MGLDEWEIDTMHSGIHFSVHHMVVAKVRGRFDRWRASFRADEAFEQTAIEVAIDVSSIRTGSDGRDAHLKSAAFLDAARFPEITFVSSAVEKLDGTRLRLTGDLALHGVTRVVAFEVEDFGRANDASGKERAGFGAKTAFDRNDFGITWNDTFDAGGLVVGALIEVEVEVEAIKRSPGRRRVQSADRDAISAAKASLVVALKG